MPVTVTPFVAHPIVSIVGRTCDVETGPQDSTTGTADTVVVVDDRDVLVDAGAPLVEAL
jgi:hypothetical protein